MEYEIERKFLVKGDYKSLVSTGFVIRQGYLSLSPTHVVRVRVKGDKGFITVKSARVQGTIKRHECEYEIPLSDAEEMLLLCKQVIDKIRFPVIHQNHIFEVDEFRGDNQGLVLAEIELSDENQAYDKPDWLGEEVTGDPRFYNSYLTRNPYKKWK